MSVASADAVCFEFGAEVFRIRCKCFEFGAECFEFGAFLSNSVQRSFEFDASVSNSGPFFRIRCRGISNSMQVFGIRGCSFEFGVSLWDSPAKLFWSSFESGVVLLSDALQTEQHRNWGFRILCCSFAFDRCRGIHFELDVVRWVLFVRNRCRCIMYFECDAEFRIHGLSLEFSVVLVFIRSASPAYFLWDSTSDGSSSMDCVCACASVCRSARAYSARGGGT